MVTFIQLVNKNGDVIKQSKDINILNKIRENDQTLIMREVSWDNGIIEVLNYIDSI